MKRINENIAFKKERGRGRSRIIQLWLIIGIVAGFLSVLFFVVAYINNSLLCDVACRIKNEVSLALILTSLFGMFVGSLTYYFISEQYERRITEINRNTDLAYRFLNPYERRILKEMMNQGESITQAKLSKTTGLSRVRVSRILKEFEEKGIIERKRDGMTNLVILRLK